MGYFFSLGYAPLIDMNPSDFLLDLANGRHYSSIVSIAGDLIHVEYSPY